MAYDLPTNGELNWDVKLNASIEAVKATADSGKATADAAIPATEKGAANGVATLGADGKVPAAQLAVEGTASSTTFTPAGGIAATNVQAAIEELDAEKATVDHSHSVTAANTSFVPAGSISATSVQAAIEELDTEKAYVGARAYPSVAQSIPATTDTPVSLDTEDHDTSGWHDTAVNNTRMTVPAGTSRVDILGQIAYEPNSTGSRRAVIKKNGALLAVQTTPALAGAFAVYMQVAAVGVSVTAGDYIELVAWQDSGASLNLQAGGNLTFLAVKRVA